MAKKRSSAKKKRTFTLKPIVKNIDTHMKKLRKMRKKKGSSPESKKRIDKYLGHLKRMRVLMQDSCDQFILPVD